MGVVGVVVESRILEKLASRALALAADRLRLPFSLSRMDMTLS